MARLENDSMASNEEAKDLLSFLGMPFSDKKVAA